MTARFSFCVKAATELDRDDLETLTQGIEAYRKAGVSDRESEALALGDIEAELGREREAIMRLVREQVPEAFRAPAEHQPSAAAGGAMFSRGKSQTVVAPGDRLVAQHNLTVANLLHADELGGLPVPSIGVAKVGSPLEGFGDIRLIGPRSMVDPAEGVPVHDADVWSMRYPDVARKPLPMQPRRDLWERTLGPAFDRTGERRHYLADLVLNAESTDRNLREKMQTSPSVMRLFADGHGLNAPAPAMRDVLPSGSPIDDEAFRAWLQANMGRVREANERDFEARMQHPVWAEMVERLRQHFVRALGPKKAELVPDMVSSYTYDGRPAFGPLTRLVEKMRDYGKREHDRSADQAAMRKVIDDAGMEQEFQAFVESLVDRVHGDKTIVVGRRKVPLTLDSLVDAMTGRVKGREDSMTFGVGKTRAMLAKRFKSIADIQKARDQILSGPDLEKVKTAIEEAQNEARLLIVNTGDKLKFNSSFDMLDEAQRVLADVGKGRPVLSAVAARGFDAGKLDSVDVDTIREAAVMMRGAPVEYFEAKPQRAVRLNEFRAAVVPKNVGKRAMDVLEKHGITVVTHDGSQEGARRAFAEAAQSADTQGDVLFARGARAGTLTTQQVQSHIDTIRNTWANAPDVVVVADMQDQRVPAAVRDQDAAQRSGGATGDPNGFFLGGKVYLVASSMRSARDVATVLLHESLGHFGLRGTFGAGLNSVLDRLALTNASAVRKKAEEYGLDVRDRTQRRIAAEEVLAEMAQTRPELNIVQRAIAAIRAWLRENLPMLAGRELTDAEIIREYIEPARMYVERGAAEAAGRLEDVAFSKPAAPFFSELSRQVDNAKSNAMPAEGWKMWLRGLTQKGVKPDEIAWTGIEEWLGLQQGRVTKEQVQAFLDANGVRVQETRLGEPEPASADGLERRRVVFDKWQPQIDEAARDWDATTRAGEDHAAAERRYDAAERRYNDLISRRDAEADKAYRLPADDAKEPKFGQYTLPGGTHYREVLLTLPTKMTSAAQRLNDQIGALNEEYDQASPQRQEQIGAEIDRLNEAYAEAARQGRAPRDALAQRDYISSHWDQPNVLAHIRLNDRLSAPEPYRARKRSDNFKRSELDALLPLNVVESGVAGLVDHDEVRRAVVAALPVDVVDVLASLKFAPEQLLGDKPVGADLARAPLAVRLKVLAGLSAALGKTEAGIRAKVLGALTTGRDETLLPTLRASDLSRVEISRLLGAHEVGATVPSDAQRGGTRTGTALGSAGGAGAELSAADRARLADLFARASLGTETRSGGLVGRNAVAATAGDAQLLDAHDAIVKDRARTDNEPKRVLFVEEIQSDWGQAGKKQGFAGNEEPRPAPITDIPNYWSIKPRTVQVKAHRELYDQEHTRVIQALKAKGLAGTPALAEAWLGADRLQRYKKDSALVREFFNQTGGAVDKPLSGDPKQAFDRMVAVMRSGVPDAFDGFKLDVRKEFGVYNEANALMARGSTEESAKRKALDILNEQATRAWESRRQANVPRAPFVTKTDAWVALALKRVIKMAVDEGYDRVAFINGEQSAERYDLSKQVDYIDYVREGPDKFRMAVVGNDGQGVNLPKETFTAAELESYVGKDVAQRIVNGEGQSGGGRMTLRGPDLKVGGEGMRAFYDKIVPSVAKDVLRKVGGGQMGVVRIDSRSEAARELDRAKPGLMPNAVREQSGFDITPAMREKAAGGLPLFARAPATDSPEFKRWFGDSKVVDAQGKPLVVYHGTGADFAHFESPLSWASVDSTHASEYAEGTGGLRGGNPNVLPVYLKVEAPFDADIGSDKGHMRVAELVESAIRQAAEQGHPVSSADAAHYRRSMQQTWNRLGLDDSLISTHHHWSLARAGTLNLRDMLKQMGFDGIKYTEGSATTYAAFSPAQIKSAIGNRGTFDPSDPDIRFSRAASGLEAGARAQKRDVAQRVRNRLSDFLADSGARVSWFEKTLGTQYAKAQKHAGFKSVFDLTRRYLEDTSSLANEAADQARDILPKLETWRDLTRHGIFQHGMSEKDAVAVAAPVYQGTLEDMRVYDAAELKSRFGLTPRQIEHYQQFRAAVDTSLDQVLAADIIRLLKIEHPAARELAINDRSAFRLRVETMLQKRIEAGDTDAAGLAEMVADKYAKVAKLKREGYAPLMRFGKYKVHVVDDQGQTQFFGLYETKMKANEVARTLSEDAEFAGSKIERGVLSEEEYKLFSQVPLDSLEMFAEAVGAEKSEIFQDFIKLARQNRSALKRLIHRKGTAGFSDDVPRSLAAFVTSNSRLAASAMNIPAAKEAAGAIREGDVKDEAIKLLDTVENPKETAGAFRGLMFVNFLGGSIASALVNVTQPVTMTLPYLSQFGGGVKAAARLMAAGKQIAAGGGSLELRAALKKAEADGIVSPQEIHHLTAQAMGTWGTHPIVQKLVFLWGAPFSLAEQFNRRVSFVAAYNTALEEKIENPLAFAEKAVTETQGLYNKANAPNWARNPIGASALTFKQFSIHYLEWLVRMYKSGPEGKKAAVLALAILAFVAGVDGLPFAADMDDLVDTLGQAMGYDTNAKRWRRNLIAQEFGFGDEFADILARGASAAPGIPFDVSLRMSMGNLIPGTGLLLRSNTDRTRDVLEIAGPAGGIAKQFMDAGQKALAGEFGQAAIGATPTAIQNVAKAVQMWETGEARDTKGRKVMDADSVDAAMRFLGFNPSSIARESEKLGMIQRSEQLAKNVEGEIAGAWARAMADGDAEGVADARQRLADWNEKNPDDPIRITSSQILRRVKDIRRERSSRFITSIAPERRARVAAELAE